MLNNNDTSIFDANFLINAASIIGGTIAHMTTIEIVKSFGLSGNFAIGFAGGFINTCFLNILLREYTGTMAEAPLLVKAFKDIAEKGPSFFLQKIGIIDNAAVEEEPPLLNRHVIR